MGEFGRNNNRRLGAGGFPSPFGCRDQDRDLGWPELPDKKNERIRGEAKLLIPAEQAKLLLALCSELHCDERLVEKDDLVGRARLLQQIQGILKPVFENRKPVLEEYVRRRDNIDRCARIENTEEVLAKNIVTLINAFGSTSSIEAAKFIKITAGRLSSGVDTNNEQHSAEQRAAAMAVNRVLQYIEQHHADILAAPTKELSQYITAPQNMLSDHRRRNILEGILKTFSDRKPSKKFVETGDVEQARDSNKSLYQKQAWEMKEEVYKLSPAEKQQLLDSIAQRLNVEFIK